MDGMPSGFVILEYILNEDKDMYWQTLPKEIAELWNKTTPANQM